MDIKTATPIIATLIEALKENAAFAHSEFFEATFDYRRGVLQGQIALAISTAITFLEQIGDDQNPEVVALLEKMKAATVDIHYENIDIIIDELSSVLGDKKLPPKTTMPY